MLRFKKRQHLVAFPHNCRLILMWLMFEFIKIIITFKICWTNECWISWLFLGPNPIYRMLSWNATSPQHHHNIIATRMLGQKGQPLCLWDSCALCIRLFLSGGSPQWFPLSIALSFYPMFVLLWRIAMGNSNLLQLKFGKLQGVQEKFSVFQIHCNWFLVYVYGHITVTRSSKFSPQCRHSYWLTLQLHSLTS